LQYAVARALLDGAVRMADFEGDAHFDPGIQPLLARTTACPHPDMADAAAAQLGPAGRDRQTIRPLAEPRRSPGVVLEQLAEKLAHLELREPWLFRADRTTRR
jgi:hypothetical protein